MAKRELIDRKQAVEVVSNGFDRWHMINLLASQESIPTITEQEIVKPYLEAIEAEAIKYSGTGEREIQAYDEGLLKAIEIIKKLLSEQEVKE